MKILRTYLKPYQWWVFLALFLAGIAQILSLYDPMWRQQIGERPTPVVLPLMEANISAAD